MRRPCNLMPREHVHGCPFVAGRVERYHTWPTVSRETVDAHSAGVLRVYVELFGPPPPLVAVRVIYHDYGEQWAGDLPFGAKQGVRGVKELQDQSEELGLRKLGVELPKLSDEHLLQIKLCDLLQMFEFGLHEKNLGNRYAEPVIFATRAAALVVADKLNLHAKVTAWMTSERRP